VWSAAIGAGNSKRNRLTAAPVVANGRVFAMDSRAQVTGLSTSGAVLWQADLRAEFDKNASEVSGGGLAAQGGQVFVTTAFGELVALDAASGTVQWRQRFDAPVIGAPAVDGGTVYAVARDGTALAVDAASGKQRWSVSGSRAVSAWWAADLRVWGMGWWSCPSPGVRWRRSSPRMVRAAGVARWPDNGWGAPMRQVCLI